MLPWLYFQNSITKSSQILITNAPMLSKIYFPRIFFPFVPVFAGLIDFALSFMVLFVLMFFYGIIPGIQILYIFPLILLMMITSSGIGLWFSGMGVYYRDIRQANRFIGRMLMYMAPVVWPVSLIPDKYRLIYGLYPMGGVIEGFRSAIIGKNPMPWDLIIVGYISATILFISGLFIFKRMEKVFADVA
ncbi:MAG: ABC transporter permease [bacterium]